MTLKSFWLILIKMLGLWILAGSVSIVSNLITISPTFYVAFSLDDNGNIIIGGMLIISILIYLLTLWFFLFKTSWLIEVLHLEKGFQETTFQFDIKIQSILSIATIILGGIMFVDGLIDFCQQVFIFFQDSAIFRNNPSSSWLILYLFKTIAGYLIMTNHPKIVAYVTKERIESDIDIL
jgi:hypothetical protein